MEFEGEKVGGTLFPDKFIRSYIEFTLKHGIFRETKWQLLEFTPGNEKNMSTWGKDRWVPRAKLLKHVETVDFAPPLGTVSNGKAWNWMELVESECFFVWVMLVMLRKALVFSQRSRSGFQIDPFRTVGQSWCFGNAITRHFWRCPTYFKKKNLEIRIISPDGAGKHMPISMEIHGNHMGIHRMSMVFRLRLPWRLIPIVWLSEIYLSKCWFNREHVGYCWLFHNVKSAILDIVDYVSFICLFYLCCSWFLWYLFHHLCVCNIWIDVKLLSFSSFCPLPF